MKALYTKSEIDGLFAKWGVKDVFWHWDPEGNCVLSEGKIVAGEMAVEDPVASLFGRYFTVRTDKRKIDHSWSVGELEHLQKDAVIEYLQMPERVRNVELQLGALRGDLSRLTEAMNRLCDLESNGQPGSGGPEGGREYVS